MSRRQCSTDITTPLCESAHAVQAVFDGMHEGFVIFDVAGNILCVNEQLLAMFGVTRDTLDTDSLLNTLTDPEHGITDLQSHLQAALGGESDHFGWTLQRRHDHQLITVEVCIRKIQYQGQEALLACMHDNTERALAQQALAESDAHFCAIFLRAGIGIATVGADGRLITANPALLRMLGYTQQELVSMTFAEFTHPDDVDRDLQLYQELLDEKRETYQMEKRYQCKDGSIRWGHLTVSLIHRESDDDHYAIKMIEDITERKTQEDQLQLMAKVIENTIEGVTITDAQGTIISVNAAFTTVTGYSAEEVMGQNPRILKSDQHSGSFYADMWDSLLTHGFWQGEIWNRRKSGSAYPEWLTISAIRDANGQATHYVAVFHDITETKQNEEQIKYQAYHDALTGLPNRQLFRDRLENALAHARRSHHALAVIFLDLDRFKVINDTLGHVTGDRLLQEAGKRLTACVRMDDTVARQGGDEFILLLSEINDPKDVTKIAWKITNAFRQPFFIDSREMFITPSMGISIFPGDGDDVDTLIKNADTALYRAKEQGRNNYQLYAPDMNAQALMRLEMESALRRALERNEFLLYFQPRVDLNTGKVTSAEALVRWQRPQFGLVAPGDFIPLAEETGLIVQIGEWVLRTACRQNQQWIAAGYAPIRVAVNLSARQFLQDTLVQMVKSTLRATRLDPHLLELEITETVAMQHTEHSLPMLQELHTLGIHLSIDDFGTGYSSLGYLKKFPVDALKIDQSFVRDIPQDQDDAAIATAVIGIAHTLNLRVIAEGVEEQAQLDFMRTQHCDEVQGFIFGQPVAHEEFARSYLHGMPIFTVEPNGDVLVR